MSGPLPQRRTPLPFAAHTRAYLPRLPSAPPALLAAAAARPSWRLRCSLRSRMWRRRRRWRRRRWRWQRRRRCSWCGGGAVGVIMCGCGLRLEGLQLLRGGTAWLHPEAPLMGTACNAHLHCRRRLRRCGTRRRLSLRNWLSCRSRWAALLEVAACGGVPGCRVAAWPACLPACFEHQPRCTCCPNASRASRRCAARGGRRSARPSVRPTGTRASRRPTSERLGCTPAPACCCL